MFRVKKRIQGKGHRKGEKGQGLRTLATRGNVRKPEESNRNQPQTLMIQVVHPKSREGRVRLILVVTLEWPNRVQLNNVPLL